ncbi:hypothetical protein GFS60_05680 [Rhodococcus sp. WAY2]|nr:hypothetical protein GFS60_05680 [Rhodococcus sp. WAY2]
MLPATPVTTILALSVPSMRSPLRLRGPAARELLVALD